MKTWFCVWPLSIFARATCIWPVAGGAVAFSHPRKQPAETKTWKPSHCGAGDGAALLHAAVPSPALAHTSSSASGPAVRRDVSSPPCCPTDGWTRRTLAVCKADLSRVTKASREAFFYLKISCAYSTCRPQFCVYLRACRGKRLRTSAGRSLCLCVRAFGGWRSCTFHSRYYRWSWGRRGPF